MELSGDGRATAERRRARRRPSRGALGKLLVNGWRPAADERLDGGRRARRKPEAATAAALPVEAGGVGATADLETPTREEESRREYAALEAPRHLFGGGAAVSGGRVPAEKRKQRGRRRVKGDTFSVGDFVGREKLDGERGGGRRCISQIKGSNWEINGVNRVEKGLEE